MAMKIIKENWLLILILIVAGSAVYAVNLNNPLFWDDTDWIVNNPFVHSFSWDNFQNWFTQNILAGINQSSNYYRPFLLFTFTFNYFLGGESPIGYHLLSNALHVADAILIFIIFSYVFKNKFLPFWISLIWLVHPLQTEAVTYISGRGDPLNVFFMLCALWLWIPTCDVNADRHHKSVIGRSILAVGCLILALLSRETAVIFPFLLIVFYISFLSRDKFIASLKTASIKALPYFGTVFVYGILRLTILNFENTLNFYSQSNIYSQSFMIRMYTFFNVLWTYAGLMVMPLWQHMERSVTIYTYFWNIPTVTSFLVLLLVLGVLRYVYKKENSKHEARNPKQYQVSDFGFRISDFRIWFFAAGWFFVNLAMTSGVTPINAQLYEHWLYLALLGPLTLVIFYLYNMFRVSKLSIKVFIILVLVSVSLFFSILSVKRNILWGDPIRFFENILKYEPDSARINNNLGYLYFDQGNTEKAEEYYWKAIQTAGNSFPQPYFNLGTILQEKGDIRGATVVFEKAIELDPNFSYPYPNLSVIYASQGNLVKATEFLEKLKELQPRLQRVYYNLALVYIERKDYDSVRQNLEDGLRYGQFDPETEPLIKELMKRFKN